MRGKMQQMIPFGGAGVARIVGGNVWSVPPAVGLGDLPTCRLAGVARGHKAMPPCGFMPTVGKAPRCGMSSTGRDAIPGVTLPLAVILTVHRLQPSHHPARQTASSFRGGRWFKAES